MIQATEANRHVYPNRDLFFILLTWKNGLRVLGELVVVNSFS